jgi:glutamyl-tRNA(Gln) amidotransferase subunit D
MESKMDEKHKGYRGPALETLKRFSVEVWQEVKVFSQKGEFQGIILPRNETADDKHIVIKLENGYNVGIRADTISSIQVVGRKEARYKIPEREFPVDQNRPKVTLFGTGGTIASRLDYRTGAVIPAFTPSELYGAVPELADICNLRTEKLYAVFSENMGPEQWIGLATAVANEIRSGVEGIVIGHGTDTMHHTAAVLSFMVQNPPVPIIMVGSQRSSDRPSSDAALNLIHATTAALSDIAEVMVCMFGPTSDRYGLLHRGTRVRKMHSSSRSTFRTVGDIPVALVSRDGVKPLRNDYKRRRKDREVILDAVFDDRVTILYFYPGMKPDILEAIVEKGYKGVVIAGTGLGHVNKTLYGAIKEAVMRGVHLFMTVQTLWGYTQMYVYDTGRDLMELGVVPAGNMLPEVAFMKLGWVLAHTTKRDEVIKMMLTPIAHEITEREPPDGYLVLQGGLPEVEKFMKSHLI